MGSSTAALQAHVLGVGLHSPVDAKTSVTVVGVHQKDSKKETNKQSGTHNSRRCGTIVTQQRSGPIHNIAQKGFCLLVWLHP